MMVPSFGFIGPKLAFGRNIAVKALADAVKDLRVTKPFLITGKSGYERYQAIISAALPDFDTSARYALGGEPSVANALEATELAVSKGCDGVIAIGGGSAIDLGKAVSALITNRGDIYDYLEVVGKALPINAKPVPYVAMPTTSGTGAEATKNAVLKCEINNLKVSMRNELMIPSIAIVDPVLTLSCPPETTAHVGLDTLCQVMEPYVSNAANPFTDALSKEAIIRASRSLRRVYADGTDVEAREDMAIASIMGGLCLANAKLGSVHGYAAVLGGKFENAPHGAICACLLPYVMRANIEKLQQMAASDNYSLLKLNRYVDVARMVTGNPSATAIDGAIWTEALVKDLNIPRLSNLCDIKREQFAEIAELTTKTSSNKGNPLPLSIEELDSILQKAF
jgi:alcohol dehydrogenase class IV